MDRWAQLQEQRHMSLCILWGVLFIFLVLGTENLKEARYKYLKIKECTKNA